MQIRPEGVEDYAAVSQINHAAFGGDYEAQLVELLRGSDDVIASLVAVAPSGELVGHIMFERAAILAGGTKISVASLAPVAVAPSWQRQGVGSKLVLRGLQVCRDAGYDAVIVVGHPSYYPRFGFSHAVVAHITNPFASGDAFMGLELAAGALGHSQPGHVIYPNAFDHV